MSNTVDHIENTVGVGEAGAVSYPETQTGHGLQVLDVVRNNGTTYVKSLAGLNGDEAEVFGIVSEITDNDNFVLSLGGSITKTSHGLGTPGQILWLSDSVPGAITTTEPTTVSKPLGYIHDADTLFFYNFRGLTGGGSGDCFPSIVSHILRRKLLLVNLLLLGLESQTRITLNP
jgi:hypothetical protein